jgi:hypothetical protein
VFDLKGCKIASMIQFKKTKQIWVSKTAEFDADFESAKKLQKDTCNKSYRQRSDRKMEFLTFITVCKSLRPINSFG